MRTSRFLAATASLLALTGAHAGNSYGYLQGGLDSTVEAGIGMPLSDQLALRASLGHARPGDTSKHLDGSSGLRVHPEGSTTVSLLADWFPMARYGFRLSAGARYNSSNAQTAAGLTGADGAYTLAGHSYAAGEVGALTGRVQFNRLQPYLGIGWESAPATTSGWRFVSDVGLDFQTGAKVTLSSTAGQGSSALQQDIATTRQQLADAYKGTQWRLGAKLGLAYSF